MGLGGWGEALVSAIIDDTDTATYTLESDALFNHNAKERARLAPLPREKPIGPYCESGRQARIDGPLNPTALQLDLRGHPKYGTLHYSHD